MKLNLNFDGKTKLKDWWDIVKKLFESIEKEFNTTVASINTKDEEQDTSISALCERVGENGILDTENTGTIVDAINEVAAKADKANDNFDGFADSEEYTKVSDIAGAINLEKQQRISEDSVLYEEIDKENTERVKSDNNLLSLIKEEKTDRKEGDFCTNKILFGGDAYYCILPKEIPEPYFDTGQKVNGTSATVKIPISVYKNGELKSQTELRPIISVSGNYILIGYDTNNDLVYDDGATSTYRESEIDEEGIWYFTPYRYDTINTESKYDSENGDYYVITNYTGELTEENESITEDEYKISINKYTNSLDNLSTTDKSSIVAAVNELVENGELYGCGELPIALEFVNGTANNNTGGTSGIGTQTTSIITGQLYPVIPNTGLAVNANVPEGMTKNVTVIVFQYRADESYIGRISLGAVTSKKHIAFDENCAYYRLRVAYSDGSEITPQEGKEYVDVGIISQLNKNIGPLSQLTTTNKASIVEAINELHQTILSTGGNV